MTDHTYAQAYADWQAELRQAARRPERIEPRRLAPGTPRRGVRRWFRRDLRVRA